jgi:hypothetical protein
MTLLRMLPQSATEVQAKVCRQVASVNGSARQFGVVLAAAVTLTFGPVSAAAQQSAPVVFDRDMSPAAGALDLLSLQRALNSIEDRLLPPQPFQERTRGRRLLGMMYRAGKFVGLDVPQDHTLMVVGHEVFGHGSRLREIGEGTIRYKIELPIPYGPGGGETSFEGDLPPTPANFLAIAISGIEAQNVMADALADASLGRGRMHYREAWLYFESRLTGLTYILSASERSSEGHDVAAFLRTVREACTAPLCTPITERSLKRRARLILADPLLYSALYSVVGSYVISGSSTSVVPLIPLGASLRYMPALGFQLAPYGTEWTMRHVLIGWGRTISISVRVGETGARSPWSIGVRAYDTLVHKNLRVSLSADVWRQPSLDAELISAPLESGGAAIATLVFPLSHVSRVNWLRGVYVAAGYKAAGFVSGERLTSGPILRAGVTIEP